MFKYFECTFVYNPKFDKNKLIDNYRLVPIIKFTNIILLEYTESKKSIIKVVAR